MIRRIITAGLLLAITLLLVFTRVGMIPVPTPAANATVAHIPAIIGGILEGPLVGLVVGLGFGFASFMSASIPMFKDPLVAILPRLFIGVTASYAFAALRHANKTVLRIMTGLLWLLLILFSYQVTRNLLWLGIVLAVISSVLAAVIFWWLRREEAQIVGLAIAAGVGSMTNTVLVLTMAVVRGYIPFEAAVGIGITHGIPEVVASAVVVVAVVAALRQVGVRRGSRLQAESRTSG
ncbi:MAG: ECF transporter S component [Chloroflexi bacterium]|nr:ECF transporter S component [Chloroflexota bacterium]